MKLLGIPALFLFTLLALSIMIDMVVGNLNFRLAFKNTLNPFLVMDPFERAVLYYFLISFIVVPLVSAHRIKKEESQNKKEQP